jgi:hypothetical protein
MQTLSGLHQSAAEHCHTAQARLLRMVCGVIRFILRPLVEGYLQPPQGFKDVGEVFRPHPQRVEIVDTEAKQPAPFAASDIL